MLGHFVYGIGFVLTLNRIRTGGNVLLKAEVFVLLFQHIHKIVRDRQINLCPTFGLQDMHTPMLKVYARPFE
jgi:hypothetical protein